METTLPFLRNQTRPYSMNSSLLAAGPVSALSFVPLSSPSSLLISFTIHVVSEGSNRELGRDMSDVMQPWQQRTLAARHVTVADTRVECVAMAPISARRPFYHG